MAGLLSKKSLYDRTSRMTLDPEVGTSPASEGTYFASEGQTIDSPFINGSGDHMVDLLTTNVTSQNSGMTYLSSPSLGTPPHHFQDLYPGATDHFSGQPANPNLGQFGGPYISSGPCTSGGGVC
jgi:hypothetical protein